MIIPDLSKETIVSSIKKEIDRIESERWREIEMFLDYYENTETDKYIEPYFDSDTLRSVPLFTQSIVRRFCSARSLVYGKGEPERHVDDRYKDYTKQLNQKCRQIEELTFLLGNMCMRTKYSQEKQQLKWDLIPFYHLFWVDGDEDPCAILYPIQRHGYNRLNNEMYAFWSKELDGQQGFHFLVDSRGNIEHLNDQDLNPYKILPFTMTRRSPRVRDYFAGNAKDVVECSKHLDLAMTELALAIRMGATGGVKWISGLDVNPNEPITIGIDKVLVLPSDTQFNMTQPSGGLKEIIDTTKFFIESVASNNHLNIRFADVGGSPVSGEALKIMNIENIEQREASVEDIWRQFENERYEIDRVVLEADAGVKLSEDLYVDFPELDFPVDTMTELQILEKKRQMGIITQRELLLYFNPDADEAELAEKMGEVMAEKQADAVLATPPEPKGSLVERLINA